MSETKSSTQSVERSFTLGTILSVSTDCVLVEEFHEVHMLFDHFYPGIITLGLAMMWPSARKKILEQHPELAGVKAPKLFGAEGEDAMRIIRPWLVKMEAKFGSTLPLIGVV